jgi:hypothetical protein
MSILTQFRALDGPFARLRVPGLWFAGAFLIGGLLRLHLVFFSDGTLDVVVWEGHAREIGERGLMAYYRGGQYTFNHPPFIGSLIQKLGALALLLDIPFRVILRAPFALLDAGTAYLLIRIVGRSADPTLREARYLVGALYWLNPVAIILSAHHGNTDSSVAFFLSASLLMACGQRAATAGALLGFSLWIKIPGLLAAPALLLALPEMRQRARFVAAAAFVGIASYLPALWLDAAVVVNSVFLYPGLLVQTTSGVPIWGMQVFYPAIADVPFEWRGAFRSIIETQLRWNTWICLLPIGVAVWLRREKRAVEDVASSITTSFVLLYGLSNPWAFQYLAWSIPFWYARGFRFAAAASLLTTGYVYGLYAWLCGDLALTGPWDFIGKPDWPAAILLLRNACILFFLVSGILFLGQELRAGWMRWRSDSDAL